MDGKGLSLIGYVGGLVSKGLAKLLLVPTRPGTTATIHYPTVGFEH